MIFRKCEQKRPTDHSIDLMNWNQEISTIGKFSQTQFHSPESRNREKFQINVHILFPTMNTTSVWCGICVYVVVIVQLCFASARMVDFHYHHCYNCYIIYKFDAHTHSHMHRSWGTKKKHAHKAPNQTANQNGKCKAKRWKWRKWREKL